MYTHTPLCWTSAHLQVIKSWAVSAVCVPILCAAQQTVVVTVTVMAMVTEELEVTLFLSTTYPSFQLMRTETCLTLINNHRLRLLIY